MEFPTHLKSLGVTQDIFDSAGRFTYQVLATKNVREVALHDMELFSEFCVFLRYKWICKRQAAKATDNVSDDDDSETIAEQFFEWREQ